MDTIPVSGKHLYKRGWLGLIPLVGAVVGLILILLGKFRYKDRRLIIIGCSAVLFTVAVYSGIYFYFERSGLFRENYAVFVSHT